MMLIAFCLLGWGWGGVCVDLGNANFLTTAFFPGACGVLLPGSKPFFSFFFVCNLSLQTCSGAGNGQ